MLTKSDFDEIDIRSKKTVKEAIADNDREHRIVKLEKVLA